MNFCGTNLRGPTKEELEKIKNWINENPQKSDESDEDYISRYYDENSELRKWVYYPQTQQSQENVKN